MNNKILIVIIVLVIILLITISYTIFLINNNNNESTELDIDFENEAGVQYDTTQLENFNLEIVGLNDEISSQIDINTLNIELKEYMYLEGLVDANQAVLQNYRIGNNILYMDFLLNNSRGSKVNIEVDLLNNSYTITN